MHESLYYYYKRNPAEDGYIHILQTSGSNDALLKLQHYPLFVAIAYDILMSEFIEANPNLEEDFYDFFKTKLRRIKQKWNTRDASLYFRSFTWLVYPTGSVSDTNVSRCTLKRHFLEGCKELAEVVIDKPHGKEGFFFGDKLKWDRRYLEFNVSDAVISRVQAGTQQFQVGYPIELYRPHNGHVPNAKGFVYNRALLNLWDRKYKRQAKVIVLPFVGLKKLLEFESKHEWEEKCRRHDGPKTWMDRAIVAPIEKYGLFQVTQIDVQQVTIKVLI